MKKVSVQFLLAAGLVLGLTGCASEVPEETQSGNDNMNIENSSGQASEAQGESELVTDDASTFADGVLTTPKMTIEITDYKVIPAGEEGNEYGSVPVAAFWYDITNLTDEDLDPMAFIFAFEAYQDNNPDRENTLNVGGLPDDQFLDTQMENIKEGGTVENAIAYELDDLETPVELAAFDNLLDEIDRETYPIQ